MARDSFDIAMHDWTGTHDGQGLAWLNLDMLGGAAMVPVSDRHDALCSPLFLAHVEHETKH